MIHKDKHPAPEKLNLGAIFVILTAILAMGLWPTSDIWERTGLIMLVVAAGILGWTRPWEVDNH